MKDEHVALSHILTVFTHNLQEKKGNVAVQAHIVGLR